MAASGRFALDDEATESTFHATKHTAKVLHLASHSFVHPTSPLYNTFLLAAGDSSSSTDDGWLFLHEIQTDDAGSIPLVVLSGCSTAEGMLRSGEGMEGLQYAFRAMGARSTVSNLWPAADDAAVELTRAFYRFLQDGHPKDVALQKAQAQYLATNPDQASPFYWASTVLYGAPDPIPLDEPSLLTQLARTFSFRSWILIGLVVSVLTGTAFAFRRDPQAS
jgi:CHAT domain-containing protein